MHTSPSGANPSGASSSTLLPRAATPTSKIPLPPPPVLPGAPKMMSATVVLPQPPDTSSDPLIGRGRSSRGDTLLPPMLSSASQPSEGRIVVPEVDPRGSVMQFMMKPHNPPTYTKPAAKPMPAARGPQIDASEKKATPQGKTIDVKEMRPFFEADPLIKEEDKNPIDPFLLKVHQVGREAIGCWEAQNNGFAKALENLLQQKLLQSSKALSVDSIAIASLQANSFDGQMMRSFFEATPINMKEGIKNSLDNFLYMLHQVGHQAVLYAKDSAKDMTAFETSMKTLVHQGALRLTKKISHIKKAAEIRSPKEQVEALFLKEVKKELRAKIFFDSRQPVNTTQNRKIAEFHPPCSQLLAQMDALERAPSKDLKEKLVNDYKYSVCAHHILEAHRTALENLCKEIEAIPTDPDMLNQAISSGVAGEMITLIKRHLSNRYASMNALPSETIKDWKMKIVAIIKYEYLEAIVPAMIKSNRKHLVDNMKARNTSPYQSGTLRKLLQQRFFEAMKNPVDVKRVFTLDNHVQCYVDGKLLKDEMNCDAGRFANYLETFSHLFGQASLFAGVCSRDPDMFNFLANEFALSTGEIEKGMLEVYEGAYTMLMHMHLATKEASRNAVEQKAKIKQNFYESTHNKDFDKVLKYFVFSQNVLGQGVLYFFNKVLFNVRATILGTDRMDVAKPKISSGTEKNEFIVRANGSVCEIAIKRVDGWIDPDFHLIQSYTIRIDVEKETIEAPIDIAIGVECPTRLKEKPEIKSLLFDLPLIVESLGLPELKIRYTESPRNPGANPYL